MVMARISILLLVGLPGAGKSTVSNILKEEAFACNVNGANCDNPATENDKNVNSPKENDSPIFHKLKAEYVSKHRGLFSQHRFHTVSYDQLMPSEFVQHLDHDNGRGVGHPSPESEWKLQRKAILNCTARHMRTYYQESIFRSPTDQTEENGVVDVDPVLWQHYDACLSQTEKNPADYITYIIDDNMYYRSMRYEYYQLARKYQIGFAQLYFDTSVDSAQERNKLRNCQVAEDIILKMATRIEPPDKQLFWEYNSLSRGVEEYLLNPYEVCDLIVKAANNPAKQLPLVNEQAREEDRIICSKSVIHQSDNHLRKLVATAITNAKKNNPGNAELKLFARKVNERKNRILEDMRTGALQINRDCDIRDGDCEKLFQFLKSIFTITESQP